jgi:hypothetical protein
MQNAFCHRIDGDGIGCVTNSSIFLFVQPKSDSGDKHMAISIEYSVLRRVMHALLGLLCLLQVTISPTAASAQSNGPFAKFSGTWRGSGKVIMADGKSERIRCTATYSAVSNGQSLSQALICASDSYRVDVRSYIVSDGQRVQGHWEETTRQATGHLDGQIVEGQFDGKLSAPGFDAALSLLTTGLRQTIIITPSGGPVSRVQIALARGG